MPISELTSTEIKAIGQKIRDIRQQRNMTLPELARDTELSASFLSRVERGACVPSLDALINLARTLGKTVPELFPVHEPPAKSPTNGTMTIDQSAKLFGEFLSGNPGIKLGLCNMQSQVSFPVAHTHPGREIVCVLEGQAEVEVEATKHRLNKGECFEFSSELPHNIWNPSKALTRVMIANISENHYLKSKE
jgi:transcriptional regulator with XRE-family HTH domain